MAIIVAEAGLHYSQVDEMSLFLYCWEPPAGQYVTVVFKLLSGRGASDYSYGVGLLVVSSEETADGRGPRWLSEPQRSRGGRVV